MTLSDVLEAWRVRYGLSRTEVEIIAIAVTEETSPAEIAHHRAIAVTTVKKHIQAICRKTQSESLKEVVIRVFRERLWVCDDDSPAVVAAE